MTDSQQEPNRVEKVLGGLVGLACILIYESVRRQLQQEGVIDS